MSAEAVPVAEEPQSTRAKKLRLWPAVPFVVLVLAAKWAQLTFMQEAAPNIPIFMSFVFGPVICCVLLALWWLLFSRAPWNDRFLGLGGGIALTVIAYFVSDKTLRGINFATYILPLAVVAATLVVFVLSFWGSRVATVAGLIAGALTFGFWDARRLDGVSGNFKPDLNWRWDTTPEQKFLAEHSTNAKDASVEPLGKVLWPQFRGPNRDSVVPGVVLDVDWKTHAPKQVWKHKVGPGWSSFSVAGNRLFTQEQRGENEDVVCYDAKTGEERWVNETKVRFDEAMGGAGPRATPTLAGGLLYVQGAAGHLQCLDPLTGVVKWKRDLMGEAERKKTPAWGYASSPLVVGDKVIAYSSGDEGEKGMLLAFDAATGEPRWTATAGNSSYSSPQLGKLAGRELVVFWGGTGLTAVEAQSGAPAWNYDWLFRGYRVIQPLLLSETSILLGTGMGLGTRRVELVPDNGEMKFEDRWTSNDMKPDFNDFVAFDGALYGLDHNILCCIDLATGTKKWKNGRYGNGQLLLLPDAGQLLVLTEQTGELVLIRANPDKLDEVGRAKVLEGKTWNHPVLVGNRVYVRNAQEAACFEVPLVGQSSGDRTKSAPKAL
jgi:outer membrane protein assembly factor BamB